MTKTLARERRRPSRPPEPTPPDRGHALTALLAVLLVITAVAAVFFYTQNSAKSDKVSRSAAGEQARRAACYYVPDIVNFDYRNLDPFFTKMLDGATGEWKKTFTDTTTRMRDVLTRSQMVSSAGDAECGLVTADENNATVVVAVAQTIATGAGAQPQPAQVAMVAEMQRHNGKWLCAKLNAPMFD